MDIPGNDRKAGFVFEPLLATVNDWGNFTRLPMTWWPPQFGLFGNASKPSKSIFQDQDRREIFLRDVWAVFCTLFQFYQSFSKLLGEG